MLNIFFIYLYTACPWTKFSNLLNLLGHPVFYFKMEENFSSFLVNFFLIRPPLHFKKLYLLFLNMFRYLKGENMNTEIVVNKTEYPSSPYPRALY
jgi:hypothetical protein